MLNMKGHIWTVVDTVTGQLFQYKRYACSGNYYMKREGETRFSRVKRAELFKSLTIAKVKNNG